MAGRIRIPAHQISQLSDPLNKYAQVLLEASARKRMRQDLEDDAWLRRRASAMPIPTGD